MICIRKISAIMEMKAKALMSKNFLIMMLFSIGYGYLMKTIIGEVSTYALSMAVLFNIAMALYVTSLLLAEEKEKNTLRVLMTSSVRGIEYFLGTVIPVILFGTASFVERASKWKMSEAQINEALSYFKVSWAVGFGLMTFVLACIGAFVAIRILKKHFEKAGMI